MGRGTAGGLVLLAAAVVWTGLCQPAAWPALGSPLWVTAYTTTIAVVVSWPVGWSAGLYLAEAPPGALSRLLTLASDALLAAPAVVVGLFAAAAFVSGLHLGLSILAGGLGLGVLNLPLAVRAGATAGQRVPPELRQASRALGARPGQTLRRVVARQARRELPGWLWLGVGRLLGECAVLVATAGVTTPVPYPLDPRWPAATLAVHLWYSSSASLAPHRVQAQAAAGALLVLAAASVVAARALGGGRSVGQG